MTVFDGTTTTPGHRGKLSGRPRRRPYHRHAGPAGRMRSVKKRTQGHQLPAPHPTFRASVNAGRRVADADMAESLFHRGRGYSHPAVKITVNPKTGEEFRSEYVEHYPPDTASAIFWLKNRRRDLWRDAPPSVVVNNNTLNDQVARP